MITDIEENDPQELNYEPPYEPISQEEMAKCHKLCTFVHSGLKGHMGMFAWLVMTNKLDEFLHTRDERKRRKVGWQNMALLRLVTLFAVVRNEDGTYRWKRNPQQFSGAWRNSPRKELRDFFCTDSEFVITETLAAWEESGVIKRSHPLRKGTQWKSLWLRFNVDKVIEVLALALAGLKQDRLGRRMAKSRRTKVENMVAALPCANHTAVRADTAKVSADTSGQNETETHVSYVSNNNKTSNESVFVVVSKDSNKETSLCSGRTVGIYFSKKTDADFYQSEISCSDNTFDVLHTLQNCGLFPQSQFDFPAFQRISYWCDGAVPGHRMTAKEVQTWANLCSTYSESDTWQFNVVDLKYFISRWIPIVRKVREVMCEPISAPAQMDLMSMSKEAQVSILDQEVMHLEQVALCNPEIINDLYDGDVVKFIIEGPACWNMDHGDSPLNPVSRFAFLDKFKVDMSGIKAALSDKLKAGLKSAPCMFYFLSGVLPLQDWAGLTDAECEYLWREAKRIMFVTKCQADMERCAAY